MDTGQPENATTRWRKRAERVALWIVIICGVAAVVWRVVWPWTGARTDLVFIGIFAIGIACLWWLGFFRRSK